MTCDTQNTECRTWYDGCNCLIPFEEFDNKYWEEILKEMKNKLESGGVNGS